MQTLSRLAFLLLLPYISYGFQIQCPNGTVLSGFHSIFSESKSDRLFYNHTCSPIKNGKSEFEVCNETVSADPFLHRSGEWSLNCPNKGYLTGIQSTTLGSTKTFRILCCSNPTLSFHTPTCYRYAAGKPRDSFHLNLNRGEVIRSIRSSHDRSTRDRTFLFQICSIRGAQVLDRDTYLFYSLSQSLPFGDFGTRHSFEINCPDGQAINVLNSLWSHRNQDRAFTGTCLPISKKSTKCTKTELVIPDGPEPTSGEIYAPKDWAKSGCRGDEVLVGLKSFIVDNIRRYEFRCCELAKPVIEESECQWVKNAATENFKISAGNGGFIRGVGAIFRPLRKDRSFRFEVCRRGNRTAKSYCKASVSTFDENVKNQVLEVFLHKPVQSSKECAKYCFDHPFCLSAGFQPSFGSEKHICLLSYRRPPFKTCSAATLYSNVGKSSKEFPKPVWFYCLDC